MERSRVDLNGAEDKGQGKIVGGEGKKMLEEMLTPSNLDKAFKKVRKNGGACGIDGMEVEETPAYWKQKGETILDAIRLGTYKPDPVKRVEIPKPNGGTRLLGIPTVIDRIIQQAILQVLSPTFESEFSENSYGFRPGKSAHQAIGRAKEIINEGYTWVVDLDLEKFFDRVNHDILMSRVARRIEDKKVLKLIRGYLNSGVMVNGVVMGTEEGTPQGGPLSPLLANILLTDLDRELEKRGHRFCRYADDCNIYVKSERAGKRVMETVTQFIEKRLKLKVNQSKSAVDRPWNRKFLGFTFYRKDSEIRIKVHDKSKASLYEKVRKITRRNRGISFDRLMQELTSLLRGWCNYFRIADIKSFCRETDKWIRRRLRQFIWKQWKRVKTRFENLMKLGADRNSAWKWANSRKGYWRISNSQILGVTITNEKLVKRGFVGLVQCLEIG
jgi:RNA-directed DNA polymerase